MQLFSALMFGAAALDLLLGDRLGLGSALREGLNAIIELLLLMTGFMALAPWMAAHLGPAVSPLFRRLGCDPSLFAGLLMSCDAGGAVLARQLADDAEAGLYNGLIVASFMGCALTGAVPLALSNTHGAKRAAAVQGLTAAFVALPFACLFTGALCGFGWPLLLRNTWPVLAVAAILLALLRFAANWVGRVFDVLAFAVRGTALFGFALAVWQEAGGPVLLPGLTPLAEIYPVICGIGVFLGGILPFFTLVRRLLRGPLQALARQLHQQPQTLTYLILTTANDIPTLLALEELDAPGVTLNVAYAVLSAYTVGDFLAFSLQFAPGLAMPMMAGRLLSGAAVLAVTAGRRRAV